MAMVGSSTAVGCQAKRLGHYEVEVRFAADLETDFQSEVRAVGASQELGAWHPRHGVPLTAEAYPRWSCVTRFPASALAGQPLEYKFVIIQPDGTAVWEEGPNRLICLSDDSVPEPDVRASPTVIRAGNERGQGSTISWEAACTRTGLGDALAVVGGASALGSWDPTRALRLLTSAESYPKWSGAAMLDSDVSSDIAWKLVILRPDGTFEWESGDNRCVNLTRGQACEDIIIRVSFGGACEAPCRTKKAVARPTLEGSARQSLIFPAPAAAHVEVIFEADGLRHQPKYDESQDAWVLALGEIGVRQGVHTFHAVVDGERVLSEFHPVAVGLDSLEQNIVLVDEGLWRYAQDFKAQMRTSKNLPLRRLDEDATRQRSGGFSPRKSYIHRPGSTSSTASTCSTSSDREEDQDHIPQPFSAHVFAGLYDGDLQRKLGGHVLPTGWLPGGPAGRPLQLWAAASRLQKPCGRCEDAFFISPEGMGIADGVGSMHQFAKYGADAAAYATELMQLAGAALRPGGAASSGCAPDLTVDARAEAAMRAAEHGVTTFGASTVAVLALEGDVAGIANLGDSGFMLLRKTATGMAIVARSEEQQHQWNCPYQLCRLPPALQRRLQKDTRFDSAADADRYTVAVQPGDLLLLFTDGFSDNLYEHEILQIVDRALTPMLSELAGMPEMATPPTAVAESLARAAQERSLDAKANVPFCEASRRHGMELPGGKPDDITVVAAWVVPEVPGGGH